MKENNDLIGGSLITETAGRAFVREWREQMGNPSIPKNGRAFILVGEWRTRFGLEWRLNEKRLREMRVIYREKRAGEDHGGIAFSGRWFPVSKAPAIYAEFAAMIEKLTAGAPQRRVITLPNGRSVGIGDYAAAIRDIKARPDRDFTGWGPFPVTGRDILAAFRAGIHERINQACPALWRGLSCAPAYLPAIAAVGRDDKRVRRRLARKVETGALVCGCRWCGAGLATWQPMERRFCGSDCRRDFRS